MKELLKVVELGDGVCSCEHSISTKLDAMRLSASLICGMTEHELFRKAILDAASTYSSNPEMIKKISKVSQDVGMKKYKKKMN